LVVGLKAKRIAHLRWNGHDSAGVHCHALLHEYSITENQ
jgi:hypothetical protein